ncbi:AAA family ATPase [Lentzea sp. NPDC034063]|uniref:ATP-binding protein n=1 Tax=unclassified Lentzea TaxID=2643253 RepID=UPI0033D71736
MFGGGLGTPGESSGQPPLRGRTRELEYFDHLLETFGGNSARVVELAGEPGMGKTRLLAAWRERAERAGARVAHGEVVAKPLMTEFAVFVDALDDLLASGGVDLLSEMDPRAALRLPEIFPALHTSGAARIQPQERHYWASQGIRALLGRLSEDKPLVLLLDDVHHAHQSSIEMILNLVRRPPAAPLLLVLTHRPRQTPVDLLSALGTAAETGAVRRIELGPLDEADAVRLLPVTTRPGRRRVLYRLSGGQPGLLNALAAGPHDDTAIVDDMPSPHPVAAAVGMDLRALGPAGRLFAQAAAVVGDAFDPALVAEVAELEHDSALAGLDELIAQDLVRTRNNRLGFRDGVVRSICYHHSGGGWRIGAHARAYEALWKRGAPLADQAHHLERAGNSETGRDAETLLAAARSTGDRMPGTVSRWLRRLLEQHDLLRGEVITRLARATALSGQLAASLPGHQLAWKHHAELDPATLAGLAESHVRVLRLLGRFDDATELMRTAAGQVELPLALAEIALDSGGDVAGLLAPVRALAEDDPRASAVHSAMLATLGRGTEAMAVADRAAEAFEEPREDVASACEVLDWLGWANIWSGRSAEALCQFTRGLELAERYQQTHVLGRLNLGLATAHLRDGALGLAVDHAADASALASATGSAALEVRAKRLCAEIGHVITSGGTALSGSLWAVLAGLSATAGRSEDARFWHALEDELSSRPGPADQLGLMLLATACLEWATDQNRARQVLRVAVVVLSARSHRVLLAVLRLEGAPARDAGETEAEDLENVVVERLSLLSVRENQVAELVARGRTNQQIARALTLSHKTVETYLRRIFDKLEVSSRSEVAAMTGTMRRIA